MPAIKRFAYTPILGWSSSRFNLFELCKRQYYYNYYSKHDPDHATQAINSLKEMTSIPIEVGTIVHDVIKVVLNQWKESNQPIPLDSLFDYAFRKTSQNCTQKNFHEIFYGDLGKIDLEKVYLQVKECLSNFISSVRGQWIINEAIAESHNWIIEPPGFGETKIHGLKAYCKVDFLFPFDGSIYIIDWKTGKPDLDKHRNQLIGYAVWAVNNIGCRPEKIVPIVAYLKDEYTEFSFDINELDIQELAIQIREQSEEMWEYCVDIEKNTPKSKAHFPKTEFNKSCYYCNFKKLCDDPFWESRYSK